MPLGLRARLAAFEARLNDALPDNAKVGFLTLYLFSTARSDRFDALADHPAWDRWTDAGIVALVGLQVAGMALVAAGAWRGVTGTAATALNDPVNAVAVPGVNDFMPVAAAPHVVAALVVATAVHEAGHALACRRADVGVEEWGVALLFGVVPVAAYVLPDEAIDDASVRSNLRMYSVGVFHNLVVAVAATALLVSPLTAPPIDPYMTYFGWVLVGGPAPTGAAVASLGAPTNLCFWLALLNANFAVLNALPVSVFDGGRVLSLCLREWAERLGRPLSPLAESAVVDGITVLALVLVVLAIVGLVLPG